MFSGQIGNLFYLARCDIASIDPANAASIGMYFKHDTHGALMVHSEDALQHMDDKVHGGKIVIEQQDLVKRRRANGSDFALEKRRAFLGFAMSCHGVNVRPTCQFFNAFAKKPEESGG